MDFPITNSCPSDVSQRAELEASDDADGTAALASFETVSVSTGDAATLDLPDGAFDLLADEASAELRAMPGCGEDVWFAGWDLSMDEGDSGWGDGDWGIEANALAAIDEATGDWYYAAHLFRTWPGGPPLDAYGVAAGDQIGLSISTHLPESVADGSEIDPTAPHWTLSRNEYAGEDMSIRLASGAVTFR